MALALVRSVDPDGDGVVLDIDTGTNPLYRVRLGRTTRNDDGVVALDEVYWASPWLRNPAAGRHLDTRVRHRLAADVIEPRALVQVVTCKPDGRATAYSTPRRVPSGPGPGAVAEEWAMSTSKTHLSRLPAPARMVGVRSARETFSRPASLDDLLGTLVQVALPAVAGLLAPGGGGTPAAAPPGAAPPGAPVTGATAAAGAGGDGQLAALLAAALRTVLQAVTGPALAAPASLRGSRRGPNRLVHGYARPFLFGIDDALLATLAAPVLSSVVGPLLQALPALVNSANQHRLDSRRADYQMIEDLMAGLDRAALVERFRTAAAAPGATAGAVGPELAQLIALLQTGITPTPAGSAAPTPAAPAPAAPTQTVAASAASAVSRPTAVTTSGMHGRGTARAMTASRAVLTPVVGPPVSWAGAPRTVLVRDQVVVLRFRLDVGPDRPSGALPRAILTVVVREPGGRDLLTRQERLTDVAPGGEVRLTIDPGELGGVPADTDVEVFAQLRWPCARGTGGDRTRHATSVQRVVFGSGRHVAGPGEPAGEPVELTDMTTFRPFWNKVWSSPAPTPDRPLWGVDLTLRYSVILVAEPSTNGVMEARLSPAPDSGGLRSTTAGRMKSGLEAGVHEIAKLAALWPGTAVPDAATMAAFAAPAWRAAQGGDAVVPVRFDGPRHTRGMLWVVPVPALRRFPVARPSEVDGYGQVVATTVDQVAFPVLDAVRVLGLVSVGEANGEVVDPPARSGAYAFEGYEIVQSIKVGLEPATAMSPVPALVGAGT